MDYLEAFRLKCWGKRDAWSWLMGLGAVVNIISSCIILASGPPEVRPLGVYGLLAGVVGGCFWLGMPWARNVLIGVPIGALVVGTAVLGLEAGSSAMMPLLFTIGILRNTRNKLFFQMEVSPEALKKAWDLYHNNMLARVGVFLGFFGMLIPGVGILALICSTIALRRVNPNAQPPIGRKGQAITGIVLGGLSTLYWGALILRGLLER